MVKLRPGDVPPDQCEFVDNLPTRELGLVGGVIAEITGQTVCSKGKLFLARRKAAYITEFADQGLTICDDDTHPFAHTQAYLSLALGGGGIPGIYIWATDALDTALVAIRILLDGTPDTDFGPAGRVTIPAASLGGTTPASLAAAGQSNGALLASGYVNTMTDEIHFLLRILQDGSLDSSFGTAGVVTLPAIGPGGENFPSGVSVVPGTTRISNNYVDPSVAPNKVHQHMRSASGALLSDVPADDDPVVGLGYPYYAVVALAGGGWAAVGVNATSPPPGWIVLWDASGAFVSEIVLPNDVALASGNAAMAALPNGKFLLFSVDTSGRAVVRRYAAGGGSVDWITTFGSGLDPTQSIAGLASSPTDGGILVGLLNQTNGDFFLGKLLANGSVDTSFGTAGILTATVDLTGVSLNVGFGQGLALSLP